MARNDQFDFWYAVNNTEVLVHPARHLETFGVTLIDYHLVSELMDSTQKVRVREGRISALRPHILTPQAFSEVVLEGFTEAQCHPYLDWLRRHGEDVTILKYGFTLRKEEIHEYLITDSAAAVADRIRADLLQRNNPLSALLLGVDEPWEVCLLKLMVDMTRRSAPLNFRELQDDPEGARHEIEEQFRAAELNPALLGRLADTLQRHRLMREYEDRFFALVRAAPPSRTKGASHA